MEDEEYPDESDPILLMERVNFPEEIASRVLEEASKVLVRSPFLCLISWLLGRVDEFKEVSIGVLSESSLQAV